jgi:hypothetical protein
VLKAMKASQEQMGVRDGDLRVVSYATARGCAAAYFPETKVLVALDSVARVSHTPTSKSIVVRLEHRTE